MTAVQSRNVSDTARGPQPEAEPQNGSPLRIVEKEMPHDPQPPGKEDRHRPAIEPVRPLTVGAAIAGPMFGFSVRKWRRLDAAGKIPMGFFVGQHKLWRRDDLERWAAWGFPDREEFAARHQAEVSESPPVKRTRNG